ncbi:MAG: hypothetical protein AAFQ80_23640 [Cyanobacteria bacterium J06621_8]
MKDAKQDTNIVKSNFNNVFLLERKRVKQKQREGWEVARKCADVLKKEFGVTSD